MFKKSIFAMITLMMVLSIVMLACGGGGLNGTWVTDMGFGTEMTWTFSGNRLTQESMGMRITMPYTVRGNYISMNYEGMDVELPYRIDGNRLIIDMMGFEIVFTKR